MRNSKEFSTLNLSIEFEVEGAIRARRIDEKIGAAIRGSTRSIPMEFVNERLSPLCYHLSLTVPLKIRVFSAFK